MDIPHQRQQVEVLLAHKGVIPVLKEMSRAAVSAIERARVPGQQPPHQVRQAVGSRAQHEMKMIGQEAPRQTRGLGVRKQAGQATDKITAVVVAPENVALLNTPHHHMVHHSRSIETRPAWHGRRYSTIAKTV
jgi:hypothetical protein